MAKRRPARRRTPPRRSGLPLDDQPWWVRAGMYFGLPTMLLVALGWWVTTKFDAHMQQTAELIEHLNQEADRGWFMLGAVQQTCINTAKSDADRLACISTTRRPQ